MEMFVLVPGTSSRFLDFATTPTTTTATTVAIAGTAVIPTSATVVRAISSRTADAVRFPIPIAK